MSAPVGAEAETEIENAAGAVTATVIDETEAGIATVIGKKDEDEDGIEAERVVIVTETPTKVQAEVDHGALVRRPGTTLTTKASARKIEEEGAIDLKKTIGTIPILIVAGEVSVHLRSVSTSASLHSFAKSGPC